MNHSYKISTLLDATHLANQHYSVCMRQGNGKEVICYIPCTSTAGTSSAKATPTAQVRIWNLITLIKYVSCSINIMNMNKKITYPNISYLFSRVLD